MGASRATGRSACRFTTTNIFTARVGFPGTYTDTADQQRFFEALETRLAALPGAQSATITASSSWPATGTKSGIRSNGIAK